MASTIRLVVPDDLDGERLDKGLAVLLDISRAVSRSMVDGEVLVDGAVGQPNTRLRSGQVVEAEPPPRPEQLAPEDVAFDVLFEDDHLLVVNKPPGLVVHPGAGRQTGTLAAGLLHRYPELRGVGAVDRWGLVHRLDQDTSGALLVARDDETFEALTESLRSREVKREYLALVSGTMSPATGTIDAAIGRDPSHPTLRTITPEGKPARTHYRVVRNYPDARVALVEVSLETGRTHQIRVHFLAIGHPVIGDRAYNTTPIGVTSPRMFLHAGRLSFAHPASGAPIVVEAPLPPDLDAVLAGIEGARIE